jgi:hypothetical protein
MVQPNEVDLNDYLYNYAVDPNNPGSVSASVNKIDKNIKPKYDDEFIVGVDHEVVAGFAIGLAFTYRDANDWRAQYKIGQACDGNVVDLSSCPIIPASAYTRTADKTVTAGGQTYTGFGYSPPADLVDAAGGGVLATNRPNYKTHYKGLEVTLNKRLANRWMSRVAFTWADWTRTYPGAPVVDGHAVPQYGNPTWARGESFLDGDQTAYIAGGSGKANFYTSFKWQVYGNALYQGPWGVDLSGSLWGRQGGLSPYWMRISGGRDGTLSVLADPTVDTHRFANLWDWDLRLSKTFKFGKQPYLTLAAEWFNVANSGTPTVKIVQVDSSSFGRIDEVMSPSIFRIGATFGF